MGKILACDTNKLNQAIKELLTGIEILQKIKFDNVLEIADYYELMASFY